MTGDSCRWEPLWVSKQFIDELDTTVRRVSAEEVDSVTTEYFKKRRALQESDPIVIDESIATYSYVDVFHPCYEWHKLCDSQHCVCRIHVYTPKAAPRASLLYLHGMNEFGTRMQRVYDRFLKAGFSVVAPDQASMGCSDGPHACVGHLNEWVSLALVAHNLRMELFPGLPTALMGHSMGGLTSFHLSRLYPEVASLGVCLSAPAIQVSTKTMSVQQGKMIDRMPKKMRYKLTIKGSADSNLVADPDPDQPAFTDLPLVYQRSNLQTAYALRCAGIQAQAIIDSAFVHKGQCSCSNGVCVCVTSPSVSCPRPDPSPLPFKRLAVLQGAADQLCEWRRAVKLIVAVGGPDYINNEGTDLLKELGVSVTEPAAPSFAEATYPLMLMPEYGHEILREKTWSDIVKQVIEWFEHGGL